MQAANGWVAAAVGTVLCATVAGAEPVAGWRRVTDLPAAPVTALAGERRAGHIAAAAAGNIYLSVDGGLSWRRLPGPGGAIGALCFLPAESGSPALVASAESGVRWTAEGRLWRPLDLAGLGRRGAVHAIRVEAGGKGRLAFGTDDGVVVASRTGDSFREAGAALPGRRVTALAWLGEGTLAVAAEEGLYRIDPAWPGRAIRIDSRPARDVDAAGGTALAITEQGILAGTPGGTWSPLPAGAGLASGASAVSALLGAPGTFAVADGFNVWRLAPGRPPSVLAAAPPGEATTVVLDLPDGRLLGATDRGLFTLDPPGNDPSDLPAWSTAAAPPLAERFPLDRIAGIREPDVASVRRAALRAASLEPARIRRNFRGVRYRALLPDLEVSLRRRSIFNRELDQDEAFTGGALRRLFDNSRDRDRERDLVIAAEWDLGSLLFNPDELDVSEEARRVLTLRDDVLDELTRIYYERRRALLDLLRLEERAGGAGAEGPAGEEITELRIRIEELTARLDAWTEGFFSREKARLAATGE